MGLLIYLPLYYPVVLTAHTLNNNFEKNSQLFVKFFKEKVDSAAMLSKPFM